jgi:hypothetical protein
LRKVKCPSIGECPILILYIPREKQYKFTAKETDSVGKVIEEVCFLLGINRKRYICHTCPTASGIIMSFFILNADTSFFSYSASLKQIIKGSHSLKLLPCGNYILIGRLVPEGGEFLLTVERPQDVGGELPCAVSSLASIIDR